MVLEPNRIPVACLEADVVEKCLGFPKGFVSRAVRLQTAIFQLGLEVLSEFAEELGSTLRECLIGIHDLEGSWS